MEENFLKSNLDLLCILVSVMLYLCKRSVFVNRCRHSVKPLRRHVDKCGTSPF